MRAVRWLVALGLLAAACTGTSAPTTSTTLPPPDPTVASSSTLPPPSTTTSSTTVPPPPPTIPAEPRPERGGSVTVGGDQDPPTLNLYVPGGDNDIVRTIAEAVHAGAFDIDPVSYELIPDLLTELPTVANGGVTVNDDGTMTVRYQIREEAVWADGVPLTGDDFRFTYEQLVGVRDVLGSGPDPTYFGIVPDSVTAGPNSFEFTLEEPTLDHQFLFPVVVPEHAVAGTDFLNDWNTDTWTSAGPFILEDWDRRANEILLVRNDNYWRTDAEGRQLPYLDSVLLRFIPEYEELVDEYLAGGVDLIDDANPLDLARFEGADATVITVDGPIWEHLNFQFGTNNPNEDSLNEHVEFRRAVAHAIDRTALADLGFSKSTGTVLRSYVNAYRPTDRRAGWNRYQHAPERARRLLAELCNGLGRDCEAEPPRVDLSSLNRTGLQIGEVIEPMLTAVGIDADLRDLTAGFFGGNPFDDGRWDVTSFAWVGGPGLGRLVDIHDVFDPAAPPPFGNNLYRWGTPDVAGPDIPQSLVQGPSSVMDEHTARFAELVLAMDATVDENELVRLVLEAEEILVDQAVFIPLFTRGHVAVVRAAAVGGVVVNPFETGLLWNVAEWHRIDGSR